MEYRLAGLEVAGSCCDSRVHYWQSTVMLVLCEAVMLTVKKKITDTVDKPVLLTFKILK